MVRSVWPWSRPCHVCHGAFASIWNELPDWQWVRAGSALRIRRDLCICAWVGNPSPAGSGAPATTSIPTLVVLSGRWPDVVAVRQVDLHLGASHLLCATKAAVEVTQLPIVRRAGAVGTGCRGDGQDLTERGRALLTVSWRPSQSEASSWPMALPARASSASSTKPNPRERPVSRSVITAAEAMVP